MSIRDRQLSERLGDRMLTDITPAVLAEYREERLGQVSPEIVREELSLVQRVFNTTMWRVSQIAYCAVAYPRMLYLTGGWSAGHGRRA